MTWRKLTWMVQGRQSDNWSQVAALCGAIRNASMFGGSRNPVDISQFMPAHLLGDDGPSDSEPSDAEIQDNWDSLNLALGSLRQLGK